MAELGTATFASSVRSRRAGTGALAPDGLPRLVTDVSLTVTSTTASGAVESQDASARIELLGPGDVVGIAPSEVLRVFPGVDEHAAEPNYLCSIEFDSPEAPWLVSLGGAERTMPWITLVVVPDAPGRVGERPGSLLPWLSADTTELPPPAELWAWAHAHAQGDASLATPGAGDGRQTLSRLLCPTRLQPHHAYIAAVVPTYEAGVLAARRQSPTGAGDRPSWAVGQGGVELPAYYHWRFQTAGAGDFEELARALSPIDASSIDRLGRLDLRLAEGGLTDLAPQDLDPVHTLLVSPAEDAARDAEVTQLDGPVATALQAAVDAAPADDGRVVRPPRYGQWPAGDAAVREGPGWYGELNLQPHHRVVARLGADMVRAQQEELVAEARRQLGEYRAARRVRDLLRLGEITATRLHVRTVAAVTDERLVTMARPVLATLVAGGDAALTATVAADGLTASLLASSFARIASRVSTRTGVPAAQMRAEFVAGSMRGDLVALPATAARPAIDLDRSSVAFERAGLLETQVGPLRVDQLLALAAPAAQAQDQLLRSFRDLPVVVHPVDRRRLPVPGPHVGPFGVVHHGIGEQPLVEGLVEQRLVEQRLVEQRPVEQHLVEQHLEQRLVAQQDAGQAARLGDAAVGLDVRGLRIAIPVEITNQRVDAAARDRLGTVVTDATGALTRVAAQRGIPMTTAGYGDLVVDQRTVDLATAFDRGAPVTAQLDVRDAVRRDLGLPVTGPVLRDLLTAEGQHQFDEVVAVLSQRQVSAALRYPPAPPRVTVDQVAAPCRTGLRAEATYTVRATACLPFAAGLTPSLIPMGFVPRYDAPLAGRLQRALEKWVLAGADRVPPNTISVLMTNPAFVEAFTAGANHELSRELLWRDIPSDARGTVFTRFWSTPLERADQLLTPLHQWRRPLGRNLGTGSPYLCVLVRSPLLRRYPNAVVQAARGRLLPLPGGTRNFEPDPGSFRTRLFQGSISPDLSYSVIDLTEAEVRSAPADQPWYVLLGEPVTEPKFGLDVSASPPSRILATWNDLAWTDVTDGDVLTVGDANLVRQPAPDGVSWGGDSASIAQILHQAPFRLVLPAAAYLGLEA